MTELVVRGIGGLRTGFMGAVSVWGFILAIPLAVAALDLPGLADILSTALGGFAGTLPYVVAAVALIAGLKATGATALVARAFEGRETRMIVLAALLGGLAPFCSCEVIPFIAALLAVDSPISAPSSGEVSASSAAHVPGSRSPPAKPIGFRFNRVGRCCDRRQIRAQSRFSAPPLA